MKSFRLEKSEGSNESVSQVGALLLILGLVVGLLFNIGFGVILGIAGVVALIAGKYAS